MYLDLTQKIYNEMVSHQFVVSYLGNFNQDLLKSLINITEKKLDTIETQNSIKKRIFHFMIECAQNIQKISTEIQREHTIFLIGKNGDNYVVYLGTTYSPEEAEHVRQTIDKVNSISIDDVKDKFYQEILNKEITRENALLVSLLDISKRTKNKISYEIITTKDGRSFLTFKTVITSAAPAENHDIEIYNFYKEMDANKIVLIYQGMFDQGMIKSVTSMTEKKLMQEHVDEGLRRKLFNVLVEGLQNICKHQLQTADVQRNSILMICESPGHYHVITGNLIDNKNIDILDKKIGHINSLNAEELKEFYKTTRLNSVISDVGGAGLGFIDMVRKSGNPLQYHFVPLSEASSFFLLYCNISVATK